MKNYYYFYKTTNNINGHYYYGVHATNDINDGYMGSGTRLNRAFKKYGRSNFTKTIFRYFVDMNDMFEYEKLIVNDDLVKDPNCYNLISGGHGGHGYKFTDEQREVQKKNAKKQWESEDLRKQNSISNKIAWSDPELKKKHGEKIRNSITDNGRKSLSERMKERWKDPEYVKWQKEKNKGENNPMYGKVPWNKRV